MPVLLGPSSSPDLGADLDALRRSVAASLDPARQKHFGQYFTPWLAARELAQLSLFTAPQLRILDPCAGLGTLSAALIDSLIHHPTPPTHIHLTCYELDPELIPLLRTTLARLQQLCVTASISLTTEIHPTDFLLAASRALASPLPPSPFDIAILNPPYQKVPVTSSARLLSHQLGLTITNLYPAFLAFSGALLRPGGELLAIVPRSFASGPYFAPFRRYFTARFAFTAVHLYHRRDQAFSEAAVLQENLLFRALATDEAPPTLNLTTSQAPGDPHPTAFSLPYPDFLPPHDPTATLHLISDSLSLALSHQLNALPARLADLGLNVSTGKLVPFRATPFLASRPGPHTIPLLHPGNIQAGKVQWPLADLAKPAYLQDTPATKSLQLAPGLYLLIKRFTSKEEPRRLVAALCDTRTFTAGFVSLENHLNYLHNNGRPLPVDLALGLWAYLNSTPVDAYFRQFSGHTQVNATDLASLPYPSRAQLQALATALQANVPISPESLDALVQTQLFPARS